MCISDTSETVPAMTKKPNPGDQETPRASSNVDIAAIVVSILALLMAGWSVYHAHQANDIAREANDIAMQSQRMTSQLVTYDVDADEDWNLTLTHIGGADYPLQEVWVTPHFADDGVTGYIEGPERAISVPPPEPGVKPTTYRIAQVDEQICGRTLEFSCDERPLKRLKLRYEVKGEPTSQYVSAPGSGS